MIYAIIEIHCDQPGCSAQAQGKAPLEGVTRYGNGSTECRFAKPELPRLWKACEETAFWGTEVKAYCPEHAGHHQYSGEL